MRIFYATKHQLDTNGSTIPEIHRDIIVLGASAYAMEAYQVPTNDNFDSAKDGALHDRLDDTKIPAAWSAAAQNRMRQFISRLEEDSSAARLCQRLTRPLGRCPTLLGTAMTGGGRAEQEGGGRSKLTPLRCLKG